MNIFAELSKNDFKMETSTQINRRESPETYLDTGNGGHQLHVAI